MGRKGAMSLSCSYTLTGSTAGQRGKRMIVLAEPCIRNCAIPKSHRRACAVAIANRSVAVWR